MRLRDESAAIREAFPAEYADVAILVTELGGTSVLMLLLAILFWLSNRRRSALVIAYAFAGFSLLLAIKAALGMPRPPEELFLKSLESDEYGFPSGHAFAAVVVYGGLLWAYDRVRDRRALAAAGTVILLVSLSRVVLGVHYLGDVVVGAVLGVAFLGGMVRLARDDPARAFAAAAVLAVPALVVTGVSAESLLGLGGSIGGLFASRRLDRVPARRSALEGGVLVAVGGGFVLAVLALESVVAAFEPLLVALYGALVAGVLLVPSAVGRLRIAALEADGRPLE